MKKLFYWLLLVFLSVVISSTIFETKQIASHNYYPHPKIDIKELKCLADNIYHEARGENKEGWIAVAHVTINRTKSKQWSRSICGVVYEGSNKKTGCQFSWTCDKRISKKIKEQKVYAEIYLIAYEVMIGLHPDSTANSKFYHTVSIRPYWSKSKEIFSEVIIGQHKFYSFKTED